METIFDWLSVAIFAGLAVLFLQRSMMDKPTDKIAYYIPAALGCALANWLGNEGYTVPAVLVCTGALAYILYVLKPFPKER